MSVLLLTMGPQLGITADLPVVGVGGAGVIRFRAIGASGPVKWTLVDSTLPAEWDSALNPDGNAVTLTTLDAETAGTFHVTVRAVDSARIPVVRSFDVRVMALPLTIFGAFPAWEDGVPATGALTISGGVPPYSGLAITSGALPAGVSLSIVGNQIVASGSPTVAGPWSATVQVSDSLSTTAINVASGNVTVRTDPYWEHVVALLHFDGPDGSTTFTDQTGKVWTHNGNAQIDTDQSRFGGASLLVYNGSAFSQVETNSHTDFDFGTDDFTVEWWQRWNSISNPTYQCAFQRGYNTAGALNVVTGDSDGKYLVLISGTTICTESTAGTTGSWVHYALTRSGATVTLWRNGVASATGTSAENLTISKKLAVGGYATDSGALGQAFNGHIDEFRITKGIARYTANFTPPDRAFPDQ